jgi:ribosome biogenesis GTPase / thiamine phosphate phosphatase
MNLTDLGWSPFFSQPFEQYGADGLAAARVAREEKLGYLVHAECGELAAKISGRLRHGVASRSELPVVGDWVAVDARPEEGKATIHAVLPRQSSFSRKIAGETTQEQIVTSNVGTVLLVAGLDADFSVRRLERYLTVAWESRADPVVVLNKADVCEDVAERLAAVEAVAFDTPIHTVSAIRGDGLDTLRAYLQGNNTVALLGSSGVGKSTIINGLLGDERQATMEVREDDGRGRHCTTHRELIQVPGGGVVIDTPGMREIQLWADEDALSVAFDDVESLTAGCRFNDCQHQTEPGCAILAALEDGSLDPGRWENYIKLQKELRHLERRRDDQARRAEQAKWRRIAIDYRKRKGKSS